MNAKSAWIGFGAGAVLAAGITYFAVSGGKESENPAPVAQQAVPLEPAPPPPAAAPVSRFRKATPADRPARGTKTAKPEPAPVAVAASAPQPAPAQAKEPALPERPAAPLPQLPSPRASEPEPVRTAPPPPPPPATVTIAAGTMLPVRLLDSLDSDRNQPGETFNATLDQPLIVDDFVIAERGARVEGRIVSAKEAGRVKGLSHMALELTHIKTSDGQRIAITTSTFEKEGEKSVKEDATKIAVGAGIGAAVGAIIGGGKGAAIGSATGAGAGTGTVLATKGKPVRLPAETRVTFALKAPVTLTEKR